MEKEQDFLLHAIENINSVLVDNEKEFIFSTAKKIQSEQRWKNGRENSRLPVYFGYFIGCALLSHACQNGRLNAQDFVALQIFAFVSYFIYRYTTTTEGNDRRIRELNRIIGKKVLQNTHPEDPQRYAKLGVNVDDAIAAALERKEPDSSSEVTLSKRIISIAVEIGHQAGAIIPMIFK